MKEYVYIQPMNSMKWTNPTLKNESHNFTWRIYMYILILVKLTNLQHIICLIFVLQTYIFFLVTSGSISVLRRTCWPPTSLPRGVKVSTSTIYLFHYISTRALHKFVVKICLNLCRLFSPFSLYLVFTSLHL